MFKKQRSLRYAPCRFIEIFLNEGIEVSLREKLELLKGWIGMEEAFYDFASQQRNLCQFIQHPLFPFKKLSMAYC